MSAIANAIDFCLDEFAVRRGDPMAKSVGSTHAGMKSMMVVCYAAVIMLVLYTHDMAFSMIKWRPYWTIFSFCAFAGSCFELLGLLIMCVKVHGTKSVAGLSSNSLVMFAASLSCRVLTTVACEGYLPSDKTGDGVLQMVDTCSLGAVLFLLYMIHKPYVHSYQEEHDTFATVRILACCAVAACFIHPDLNQVVVYDTLWAFSLNAEIFQMLPQLYMLSKVGGKVDRLTSHYVANLSLSCLCRFAFWWWAVPGCNELAGPSGSYKLDELTLGGWFILGGYFLETLIHLDFMYYYVKSWYRKENVMHLPSSDGL